MRCLLLVRYQSADDRFDAVQGELLGLFSGLTGEWMLDHHHRVFGQSQGLSPDARRPGEGLGDHGDGGAAPLLGFDPVVETPRGA
jgi:hypothetical protein